MDWFARAIFHVTDVETSVGFYVDRLGFTAAWRHEDDDKLLVAQVERNGCAIILASTWAEKAGKGSIFISLNPEPWSKEAQAVALDALRAEFTAKGAQVGEAHWGYRVVTVADPDGNTLLFNYSD